MDTLLKPEIIVPILVNIVLAGITFVYMLETRSMRKAIARQLEVARRQHFVSTAPFVYAAALEQQNDADEYEAKLTNPSEKLARDVKYIVFEENKKTFRMPDRNRVVLKPGCDAKIRISASPFTKSEVVNKIKKFYGLQQIDEDLVDEGNSSYVLLLYTDVEGSVYSVKANFTWNEDGDSFSRKRSRFKKIYDPRD